ncbi:hypothetical protein DSO57_1026902 [Entomophthora muscae]|uniref:Uncharacterized protein n=1 Tax=Entomophthora muscae TaxID=34485 RepID=A0ACC2UM80_9FUNG|nr:hypothetical protein DSO57_1026902 [Entomophthora muscae]
MALIRKKKSASTTKSNTPTPSPRRRSESKEIQEKGSSDKQVNEPPSETNKPEKSAPSEVNKRPSRASASLSRPLLRSRLKGQTKNNVPKNNPKKTHKPSPLSLKDGGLLDEKTKEQDQSDKLESAKELESIAEQPDEKIYNPSRRWSVSSEILLLKCLADNKPSGIHKHFHMANICYLFNKNNASPRSSKEIWDHVDSMYDLQAIDEMVPCPQIIF